MTSYKKKQREATTKVKCQKLCYINNFSSSFLEHQCVALGWHFHPDGVFVSLTYTPYLFLLYFVMKICDVFFNAVDIVSPFTFQHILWKRGSPDCNYVFRFVKYRELSGVRKTVTVPKFGKLKNRVSFYCFHNER